MMDIHTELTSGLTVADAQLGLTPVELYTQSRKVVGQLARGNVRISDILNQVERPFLTIERATIAPISGDCDPVRTDELLLNTRAIVFVIPRESRTPRPPVSGPRPTAQVDKQRHYVGVEAPPFSITGFLHLVRETKVRDALLTIHSQFIPLTEAVVTLQGTSDEPIKAEAVVLNRAFVHILYALAGPQSQPSPPRILLRRL